jgi:RIO-like serine/threonine protein kinase
MIMTSGPKLVKVLNGHSGSEIYLMQSENLFVRKVGNTKRNIERLTALKDAGYPVPEILQVNGESFDMEYIHGLDMKSYLVANDTRQLEIFIHQVLDNFKQTWFDQYNDYTSVYEKKLEWMDTTTEIFPFTKQELIDKLPKILPKTMYFGDLTLENILYSDKGFKLIDAVTIEYDSYIFDIAKLRQDLECRWFLRKETMRLGSKLVTIQDRLLKKYPEANNDYLLILMLLRVFLHTTKGDFEYEFIMKEIKRLWK